MTAPKKPANYATRLDRELVQRAAAQVPWFHNWLVMDRGSEPATRQRHLEYALGGSGQPISVAEWETQLTRALPSELQGSLPTIEEIEAELSGDVGGGDE